MKILFVSPAIEEKPRGIGAIFNALIQSAKSGKHSSYLLLGYPEKGDFLRSRTINDKLEHLTAQQYVQNGRESLGTLARRSRMKVNLLESAATLAMFRPKLTKVQPKLLKGPKTVINDSDYMVQSPYFFILLNFLPPFLSQMLLNRVIRKYDIDLVVVAAPSVISNKRTPAQVAHFVHDTMPLDLVEAPPDNNTPARYAKQFYSTCANSDIIFTNSEDTAKSVKDANPDANVHVLYGTASSRREDVEPGTIMKRKGLEKGKFLLFTSTIEKRKNVESLLKAYAQIHDEIGMKLVVVGGEGYGYDQVMEVYNSLDKKIRDDILFPGYVTEADKFELFDNAFAFVFPSIYEGMGLMLIEAMQAGIPVIASNKGALPEAGGDAAYYIEDPYDTEEIAQAILTLKKDPKLVQKLVKAGEKQQKKFTFEKFAERFERALKSLDTKKTKPSQGSKATFMIPFMRDMVKLSRTEIAIVVAVVINSFNYWPTFTSSALGGFSFEISMLTGVIIVLCGIRALGKNVLQELARLPVFGILYAWLLYGMAVGVINSDSPEVIAVKSLYLLSIIAAAHMVAALHIASKIQITNVLKGWMFAALAFVPLFIIQYVAVSLGADALSKDAYEVGVFEFPRLHGFSFEPLFLANWLIVPLVYALVSYRTNRMVAYLLSFVMFLTLARGAILALIIALLVYMMTSRNGVKAFGYLFKPLGYGLLTTLIFVGVAASLNSSTPLQGAFRYMDHLTLGVFNPGGASNVRYVELVIDGEVVRVIDNSVLDQEGAVEASAIGRLEGIERGLEFFGDEPITGVGLFRLGEEAQEKYPVLYVDGLVTNVQPIDVLAETGIIGVAMLGAFAALTMRRLFVRSVPVIMLLGLALQYLFFTNLFLISFWLVLGVVVSAKLSKDLKYE